MPALPALTKAYSVRANVPFQSVATQLAMSQSMMFSLKEHMKNTIAGGSVGGTRNLNSVWTVKGSSNSTTAALDNTDRWAAFTNLVWAASGTAHSWIVLENTALGYQLCIDCVNATSTQIGIAVTEIAVPFTGGSTTTRPTSASEFCFGQTAIGVSAITTFLTDTTTGNFNWTHFVTTTDGQFYFLSSRTGGTRFTTFFALLKTVNQRAGDSRNVFVLNSHQGGARGAPEPVTIVDTAAGCVGRNINGSINTLGGIQRAGTFGATNYVNNETVDSANGQYMTFPCNVMSLGTQVAYRGELPDFYQIGAGPNGGSFPTAAAQERIIAGGFLIPFPTVAPIV